MIDNCDIETRAAHSLFSQSPRDVFKQVLRVGPIFNLCCFTTADIAIHSST